MSAEVLNKLKNLLQSYAGGDCALAFSGGADSVLLLKLLSDACRERGTHCLAVYVKNSFGPQQEAQAALQRAEELGAQSLCLELNEMPSELKYNPVDRCYLCKRQIFQAVVAEAEKRQIKIIMDGTNGDDIKVYRPGLKALAECGIISPLARLNISKAEVRRMLDTLHLKEARKPAAPCMATRFAYGMELNEQRMQAVAAAEEQLRALGFYNVRLRVHSGAFARVEVDAADLVKAAKLAPQITSIVKAAGLNYVMLDLQGFRSGSMDELL